jgi:alkylation response protein AidB-like acyl-CoA dehydrogenase
MKIEACRVFAWKAAHYLDLHDPEGHVAGAVSKVHCSETMFQAVFEAMQVMGVNSTIRTTQSSAIFAKRTSSPSVVSESPRLSVRPGRQLSAA